MNVISRRISETVVWTEGNTLFKQQPKYLADTEFYFLMAMQPSGYVPGRVEFHGIDIISMELVQNEYVTDVTVFMSHYSKVLDALKNAGIRHGDLTEYSVLVRNNKPVLIDFSESRLFTSPIKSKRPEGDGYWLRKTMEKLSGGG